MRKAEACHLEATQAPVASANGCRPPPIGANLDNPPAPSSRTRLFSKSLIWSEKSVSRDPLAVAAHEPGSSRIAGANGSRIARFASEIGDFGQTGFRDDGGDVLVRRLNLAPMGLRRHDGGVGIWGTCPRRHPGAGHPGFRGLRRRGPRVCGLNPCDSTVQLEQLILRAP